MRKVTVRCTYVIEVEVPDDNADEKIRFDIEANGCPGTGAVGAAFDANYEECEKIDCCWACSWKVTDSKNEVIKIE